MSVLDDSPASCTWQRQGTDWALVDYDEVADTATQGCLARYVGTLAKDFYHDRPDIVTDMSRCYEEKRVIMRKTEYTFRTTGEQRYVAITCVPVIPDRIQILAQDITAEVEDERSLQAAREAAETARDKEESRRYEAERRRLIAEGLGAILAALNSDQPLEQILDLIASRARRLLDTQAVAIYRLESEADRWSVEASRGLLVTYIAGADVPVGQDTLRQAIVARRPVTGLTVEERRDVVVAGTSHSGSGAIAGTQAPPTRASARTWTGWYKAWLAVPIITKDEVFGGMLLYYGEPRTCSDEEVRLAVAFSDQAALAIENANLRERVEQAAAAAERERLARDLHDAVTQTLFSASVIAEALPRIWTTNPQDAQDGLKELGHLTRSALAEMRTLLLELRPAALLEKPLGELFHHLVNAVSGQARIPVALKVEGDSWLRPELQVALYRIAQEALNNACQHARAGHMSVHLRCAPESVRLEIVDDGRGFACDSVSSGTTGLNIMRERAAAVHATLCIDSELGAGTCVRVDWEEQRGAR